jgi:hypothetical protein
VIERQISTAHCLCMGTGTVQVKPRKKGELAFKLPCHCQAGRMIAIPAMGARA